MKARAITKAVAVAAMILLALACAVPEVFAWGSATHAYLDDHLGMGKKQPLRNMNEIYGGMAADVFNYVFEDINWYKHLYMQTHYVKFDELWKAACSRLGKSEAYGFVSHNGMWGADLTAHHSGLTFGQGKGYVIAKAEPLVVPLQNALAPYLGSIDDATALELCHNVVEAAVDILVAHKTDRMIGNKMASSAILRSPEFPLLLVKAYAQDFADFSGKDYTEAVKFILKEEKEFRKIVVLYGQALTQEENTSIQLVSEQMAALAISFLGLPSELVPPAMQEALVVLARTFIEAAMASCASDYSDEISKTINFVRQQLTANHIVY